MSLPPRRLNLGGFAKVSMAEYRILTRRNGSEMPTASKMRLSPASAAETAGIKETVMARMAAKATMKRAMAPLVSLETT